MRDYRLETLQNQTRGKSLPNLKNKVADKRKNTFYLNIITSYSLVDLTRILHCIVLQLTTEAGSDLIRNVMRKSKF